MNLDNLTADILDTATAHQALVQTRFKPSEKIHEEFTKDKANLLHAVVGIVGEAGELLDAVKKVFAYNKDLDKENVIEELGDIEFYLEALRQHLGVTRDAILVHNIVKLTKRYEKGYSDQEAALRKDKNG